MTQVLMLGWEYPPHGTGGMAPATAGVVSGLLANGVDVLLHLPMSHGVAGRVGIIENSDGLTLPAVGSARTVVASERSK